MDKDFHMIEEEEDAKMNCCLSSFQAHLTIAALATHICSFPFLTASRTSATDLRLWQSLTVEAPRQERAYLLHANWCLYFCDLFVATIFVVHMCRPVPMMAVSTVWY